jgi:S-formylglutathione hydrolase
MRCSRNVVIWIGALVAILLLAACSTSPATPTSVPPSSTPPPTHTVEAESAKSELLWVDVPAPSLQNSLLGHSGEQQAVVYVPPSYYVSDTRYPVVYFLPGYETDGDNYRAFTNGNFEGFFLLDYMDAAISAGTIDEMIVVIPNGQHRLGGSFYVNSPVTGDWEDFIAADLVSYMDSNYRTLQSAESRGIAGHSMGGYGALNLAMLHPDVFSAVYGIAPGLFDPAGLSNCQMFDSDEIVDEFLEYQDELAALSSEAAHAELVAAQIYGDLLFAVNYGMAFSPDGDRNAPYISYPYSREGDELVRDEEVWKAWQGGFGGIADQVERYRDNLLALTSIVVDYGTYDHHVWIREGCEYLSEQMTAAEIPHQLVTYTGGHDQIRDSMEQGMLPFFSDTLQFE